MRRFFFAARPQHYPLALTEQAKPKWIVNLVIGEFGLSMIE